MPSSGATQKTSVAAMGLAPRPVPMMSRMQPPMPVAAPPYGSIALGRLCVSHLKHTAWWSSKAMTPELSTNTDRHQSMRSGLCSSISSNVPAATVLFKRFLIVTDPSLAGECPGRSVREALGAPACAAEGSVLGKRLPDCKEYCPAPKFASR